jgi:hypothetical protein
MRPGTEVHFAATRWPFASLLSHAVRAAPSHFACAAGAHFALTLPVSCLRFDPSAEHGGTTGRGCDHRTNQRTYLDRARPPPAGAGRIQD